MREIKDKLKCESCWFYDDRGYTTLKGEKKVYCNARAQYIPADKTATRCRNYQSAKDEVTTDLADYLNSL